MARRSGSSEATLHGLATLCVGVGQGEAAIFRR